jgi:putative ABC transport system substrate-binding protein
MGDAVPSLGWQDHMRRRDFITVVGCTALAWPLAARAQQGTKVRSLGFLYPGPRQATPPRIEALLTGLRTAGYSAPAQVELVLRIADGDPKRIAPMVLEIIERKVDVIIANGSGVLNAFRSATGTIPIVALDLESDPVGSGLAASLARPGGNITGLFFDFPDFTMKWLELLKEAVPRLSRVAVLRDPTVAMAPLQGVQRAAEALNIHLNVLEVQTAFDFDDAFVSASQQEADAVLMLSAPLFAPNVHRIAELALRHRLPAITLFPDFARAGGLLAYGPNLLDLYRQVGVMSGKVLRGEKPASMPIERPTKFELVLNLRTAKAIGLDISTALLLRADEIIE